MDIMSALASAAGEGVKVSPGWTPTTTIAAIQSVLTALFGGLGVYGLARALALLWKMANERSKQDNDAAASVRREMMEFNDKLQIRIDALESAGREDRRKFDEEMSNLRKAHAEEVTQVRNGYETEIRNLRDEIAGLRRQMAQWSSTSEAAQNLAVRAPTSAMKRADVSGMGDILREAFDIPGIGEN